MPVIVISGGGGRLKGQGSLFTAKALGAAVILQKPFKMSELLSWVAAVFKGLEP